MPEAPPSGATATEADPIEAGILSLTAARDAGKSICLSEVARAVAAASRDAASPVTDWRALLPAVRRAAMRLAAGGRIEILRKGRPVDPASMKGVIRLRARGP